MSNKISAVKSLELSSNFIKMKDLEGHKISIDHKLNNLQMIHLLLGNIGRILLRHLIAI